jgi:hypothetical protein
MARPEELVEFEVLNTRIKDSQDQYRSPGETGKFTRKLARHYHDLGLIRKAMDDLFSDVGPDKEEDTSHAPNDSDRPATRKPGPQAS